MKITFLYVSLTICLWVSPFQAYSDSDFPTPDSSQDNKWVAPPPSDGNDRLVKFNVRAAYQNDADLADTPFVMIDMSAQRALDENASTAEGLIRFRKALSISDAVSDIDIRLAKLSYLEPWLQVTAGRFDLFQNLSPNLFFGAYPIMGVHRVDGVWATLPFSFFFDLGPSKEGKAQSSSPLALSFFYTPSLFSAQQVQNNGAQGFWLTQLRFRIDDPDFVSTFRVNVGESINDDFEYSSLNGGLTGSVATEMTYQKNSKLTAEYGVQNLNHFTDTGTLSLGFQAERLGTWGAFSVDQIGLEAQFPLGGSIDDPFTGGNAFNLNGAGLPQPCWYVKVKTRLRLFFIELHVTNNQNDFTYARLVPGATAVPFTGVFGPGNETNGPGTSLRATAYNQLAYLLTAGMEF